MDELLQFGAQDFDRYVGLRIRMRRRMLSMTQERLANEIDVTFQQVQKYECGVNRVSASKLWEVGRALEVPVGWFYEGLGESEPGPMSCEIAAFLGSSEGLELARAFAKLSDHRPRRKLVELMKAIADETAT